MHPSRRATSPAISTAPAGTSRRPRLVRRRLAVGTAAGTLLLGGVAAPGLAQPDTAPVDGASGVGDAYWPLDGNGGIDVQSYTIDNAWSFRKQRLSGSTTVRLVATQDLASFSLDFLLPVSRVRVDGQDATVTREGPGGHELRIRPAAPLAAGTAHSVVVRYAGKPAKLSYAGERAWLGNREEVVAMGEPHMAPWWFPSNDHPSDKALVDVSVTVPKGREAVSNGHLVSRRTRDGRTTWHWRADEPMTSYLAFFAVGDFALRRGSDGDLPWAVAVSRRLPRPQRKDAMRLMLKTPRVVRWLEGHLGPYPFSTTGGLTTSLPVGFALENQTRPTYPAVGPRAFTLLAHELAHQWFGDHVAVAQWRDIWLNEGFATFMSWLWDEEHGGMSAQKTLRSAYRMIPAGSSFWETTIGDPGADKVFDGAVYDRGAMTLQALRNRLGDEVFFTVLRTWLERKAGGNGTVAEFEALAEEVSAQELTGFFDAWLRTPTRPARTAENGLA